MGCARRAGRLSFLLKTHVSPTLQGRAVGFAFSRRPVFSGIFVGRRGAAQMLDLVSEKWEPRLALPLARDALGDARGREHASVTKAPVMT